MAKWQEEQQAEAKRRAILEADAENWHVACDFLTERKLLKEFLLWEAKRNGASDFAYAAMERATDKITYGQNTDQQ